MRISNKTSVQSILSALQFYHIRDVVYSPGSRNAPFAISMAEHTGFDVRITVDERSAGFQALGMAQQSKKPAVLICTSGTAPLNYAPAVAEAYYQEVPLIVVTADRPPESIDQGEGQCIQQKGIFSNFIKYSANLSVEENDEAILLNHEQIYHAMVCAMQPPFGPVHINVPFQEPLYQTTTEHHPLTQKNPINAIGNNAPIPVFPEWNEHLNYLLIVGQNAPSADFRDWIQKALQFPNITVLTESHGNVHGLGAIDQIDRWIMSLSHQQKDNLHWDVVVSLGHNVISRKIKSLIKEKCKAHWSVQFHKEPINTYRLNPRLFHCQPLEFLRAWLPISSHHGTNENHPLNQKHSQLLDAYFQDRPHSDLKVFHQLSKVFPEHAMIQMGNSSVVRYLQLMEQRPDLVYFGNRGVSGIDGATSTAVGASWKSQRPVVLVTGDLSFLYDANGLWMDHWPSHLKVVVIDNGGGGIFRIIDGAKEEPTVPVFFETPHKRDIVKWAKGWGWEVEECGVASEENIQAFFKNSVSQILVIKTPTEVNPIELDLFFKYFKEYNERVENNQGIH